MRKILFTWRGHPVYSYPAMLYVGMLAGTFAGAFVARGFGLNADSFAVAAVILLVPALVGARLYFVLTRWGVYRREPRRIWPRSEGGMAMHGGLILAVPLSLPLLWAAG
jgi:phosphatidylglycerol---prolipoprotein diacylglyceryl transferase